MSGTHPVAFGEALAGDRFVTAGGEEVRLAGILALGSGGERVSEGVLARERGALALRLGARFLTLAFTAEEHDRYGRVVAQVFADGEWVQGAILSSGLARAAPDVATNACAAALLRAEAIARSTSVGHWSDGQFDVVSLDHIMQDGAERAGTFAIVEGVVADAAVVRGRAFLNYGADYRTDFTVTVAPEDMKNFRAEKLDLRTLEGVRIRVRGWLELYNGPELPIAAPGAIEILE